MHSVRIALITHPGASGIDELPVRPLGRSLGDFRLDSGVGASVLRARFRGVAVRVGVCLGRCGVGVAAGCLEGVVFADTGVLLDGVAWLFPDRVGVPVMEVLPARFGPAMLAERERSRKP